MQSISFPARCGTLELENTVFDLGVKAEMTESSIGRANGVLGKRERSVSEPMPRA